MIESNFSDVFDVPTGGEGEILPMHCHRVEIDTFPQDRFVPTTCKTDEAVVKHIKKELGGECCEIGQEPSEVSEVSESETSPEVKQKTDRQGVKRRLTYE
jgi:hypothetical protein